MLIALALAPAAEGGTRGGPPGAINFIRNATTEFTPWLVAAEDDSGLQKWMRGHYWEMRGYAPSFSDHTFRANPPWTPPPTQEYTDLFALYRDSADDQQTMAQHPDWVLKNTANTSERLYIRFGCDDPQPGCPQFAGDIGNAGFRDWWIDRATETVDDGYVGLSIDDVNLSQIRTARADGTPATPRDPRTGQAMTLENWKRYTTEFVEEIRDAFPTEEMTVNQNQWWVPHDSYADRVARTADFTALERGFNDDGIVNGSGQFGYESLLAHVDWLHDRGRSVLFEPRNLGTTSSEYELASHYLVRERRDAIVSDYHADPDDWWSAWKTDLGRPRAPRYSWNGLFRRDFVGGMALTNQPNAATRTVTLPAGDNWQDLSGDPVTSLTLAARRGAVLLRRMDTKVKKLRLKCKEKDGKRKLRLKGRVVDEVGDPLTAGPLGRVSVKIKRKGGDGWAQISRRKVRLRHATKFKKGFSPHGASSDGYRAAVKYQGSERYFRSKGRSDTCSYN